MKHEDMLVRLIVDRMLEQGIATKDVQQMYDLILEDDIADAFELAYPDGIGRRGVNTLMSLIRCEYRRRNGHTT